MQVEIYSKDFCGYCDMAINLAKINGHNTIVKKLGVDFSREELLVIFPDARSFPQVVADGKHIGGYQEFALYLQERKPG